jgi:superfamily II DNA or RNA helicase
MLCRSLALDTLFLAMPISWKGTLQQYVGRLHRLHDAKRVVRVYDYVDSNVLMLARMYARRLKRVHPDRLHDPGRQQRNVVLSAG